MAGAGFVFICRDSHCGPLKHPYYSCFHVISHRIKTFCALVGEPEERILIDCLKPAHVDLTGPVTTVQPPQCEQPPRQTEPAEPPPVLLNPQAGPFQPKCHTSCSGRTVQPLHGFR